MIIQSRRYFITGLTSLLAAPAIVRVQSIMPVRSMKVDLSELLLWPSPEWLLDALIKRIRVEWKLNPLTSLYIEDGNVKCIPDYNLSS